MTTKETANDILSAEPTVLTLSTGTKIRVERLKTRQTLRAIRVLTTGAADILADFDFNSEDEGGMAASLLAALIFAVPEAEDETIDFIQSMVSPYDLKADPKTKADKLYNADLYKQLEKELFNPELDDLISIVEVIVKLETPHIAELGKRLMLLLPTAKVVAQKSKKS